MERILIYLTAIAGLAKDIHYTVEGYGNHLLMDRIYDGLYDFVDEIKENYYMYLGREVPKSTDIFREAATMLEGFDTTQERERNLLEYMLNAIYLCDEESKKQRYDCGDNDLLGRIASKLKNNVALLRKIMPTEIKPEG